MFCINCGNQMPEDTKFCGSCGTGVTQGDYINMDNTKPVNGSNIRETIDEIGKEIISLAKDPINTVKEIKSKNNNIYMILGLAATILAILNVYILKSAIIKTIGGTGAGMALNYMLKGKHFGIIIGLLINNIAIIVGVSGIIFVVVNVLLKKSSFIYFDGLKVLIAGYAYSTIIVFIGSMISYIYLPLGIFIISISFIAYMILVYEGINSFEIIDKSKCLYMVLIVMLSIIIFQYMIISMKVSSIIDGFNLNSMDILENMFF